MNFGMMPLALSGALVVAANILGTQEVKAQAPAPLPAPLPFPVSPRLGVYVVGTNGGLLVNYVVPNTPAAYAGIRVSDVITSVGYQPVYFPMDISRLVSQYRARFPYGNVPVVVLRWQNYNYFGWVRVPTTIYVNLNGLGVYQSVPNASR